MKTLTEITEHEHKIDMDHLRSIIVRQAEEIIGLQLEIKELRSIKSNSSSCKLGNNKCNCGGDTAGVRATCPNHIP